MKLLRGDTVANNSGWAAAVGNGQVLRITTASAVSFVCFKADDLTERFDQARTKVYNMRLWIGVGEQLFSKLNNPMMTVVLDEFAGLGRHDLQFGMCSGPILAQAAATGEPDRYAGLRRKPVPDHGCLENLAEALRPWTIPTSHIPMPLNLFQHTEIDTGSGVIRPTTVRPPRPIAVELRAEMDVVVALSACPDVESPGGPVKVDIVEPG